MRRVTAYGRALPIALLVFATSACGDGHERLLEGWERDGREIQGSEFSMVAGPAHCEQDDALILSVSAPRDGEDAGGSFVRDPEGAMADYTDEPFVPDAELPDDAVSTGYENDAGVELWLANDHSTAYLVDGDTVEAWPAVKPSVCA